MCGAEGGSSADKEMENKNCATMDPLVFGTTRANKDLVQKSRKHGTPPSCLGKTRANTELVEKSRRLGTRPSCQGKSKEEK
jgi:hypothetical protein